MLRAVLFGVITVTAWDLWERGWDHEFKVRRVHAAISVKFSVSSLAIIRFSYVMHRAIKSLTPNEKNSFYVEFDLASRMYSVSCG